MSKVSLRGRTVLITGAARGLGRALALDLGAREGSDLVLVDRDEPGLKQLAGQIGKQSSGKVRILVRDLLQKNCAQSLFEELESVDVHGLVNNAGLTFFGPTEFSQLERYRAIIELDFRLVVELTLLFLSRFQRRGGGFICNVTSLGSFIPIPFQAVYAAAKGAAQSFSESLYHENRRGTVTICTVSPSGIASDMIAEAGLARHMRAHRFSYLGPEEAARQVIRGLKRGRRLIIPGFVNRLIYLAIDVLPRNLLLGLAGRVYDYDKYGEEP
jgi:short-subunit dehydrogenase